MLASTETVQQFISFLAQKAGFWFLSAGLQRRDRSAFHCLQHQIRQLWYHGRQQECRSSSIDPGSGLRDHFMPRHATARRASP